MDSDNLTAFASYFKEDHFELRPGADRDDSATLFLSFDPALQTMSLAAYDYKDRKGHTHELYSTDPSAVAPHIAQIEAYYGVKVPRSFRTRAETYLSQLDQCIGVRLEMNKEYSDCEYCGVNENKLEAFYYPAFDPSGRASLGVVTAYGCYGGDGVYGEPEEVAEEARRIIESAIRSGDDPDAKEEARQFLRDLNTVLAG